MSNYKPIDLSKEDFRKYLDRQGVLDAITKVLVKCNTERPEHALAYVVETLNETHGSLKTQLLEANQEIERLKKEISALKVEDKAVKAPSVKQEPEIATTTTVSSNGGAAAVEIKTEADDSVGEAACAAVTVKQERDAGTSDVKPKEAAALTSNEEVQETSVVAGSLAASPKDATDAKEPNTNENK